MPSPFRLDPYIAAYSERFPGAMVPTDRMGRTLKTLESRHGPDETLRRWKIFLAKKGEYGVEVFARTWSDWGSETPAIQTIPRASENGDAGKVFAAIRALVRETPNPGRGMIRSIPKSEVEQLGQAAYEAYQQVGGAERFLSVTGEGVGFLLRDFNNAYRAASAHARSA